MRNPSRDRSNTVVREIVFLEHILAASAVLQSLRLSLLSQGDGDGLLERAQQRRQGFCPAGWNITWAKFARKSRQRNQ